MDASRLIDVEEAESLLLEPLLGVHAAINTSWLADAVTTAAERGLGALHGLLFLLDASGHLTCEMPASTERRRALAKLRQVLGVDLGSARFDPHARPASSSAMAGGRAIAVRDLSEAMPVEMDAEDARAAQRLLGVGQAWLAPLCWDGDSLGLLVLLMPSSPPAHLAHAEALGRHVAVAISNLREKEAGRKHGEMDAVRWVYDEGRFAEQLALETRRAHRHGRPLSILLLRIQNLVELRARFGRFLTERLLRQVAGQLADAMRDTDFLGASGNDGFAAILVESDQQGAQRAKERLLSGLEAMELPHIELPGLEVRLGCATATLPDDGEEAEGLLAAAKERLDGGEITLDDVEKVS